MSIQKTLAQEMPEYSLQQFVQDSCKIIEGNYSNELSDALNVEMTVPLMQKLLSGNKNFLKPEHFQSHPDHYARNAIFVDDNNVMSLYAIVWEPGQWTPIHDHGTWGVMGIYEGVLEECNYVRSDSESDAELNNIDLDFAEEVQLTANTVTSFVPRPEHIHKTGNPSADGRVVSLHLYGNAMAGFHIYDRPARTRKWIEVSHNES